MWGFMVLRGLGLVQVRVCGVVGGHPRWTGFVAVLERPTMVYLFPSSAMS